MTKNVTELMTAAVEKIVGVTQEPSIHEGFETSSVEKYLGFKKDETKMVTESLDIDQLISEEVELHEAMPDWAAEVFHDAASEKHSDIATSKPDTKSGSRRALENRRAELKKKATTTHIGTRGTSDEKYVKPDHSDNESEHKSASSVAEHPWIPKPKVAAKKVAAVVSQGVTTHQEKKGPSETRVAAVKARAATMTDPAAKARLLRSIGEDKNYAIVTFKEGIRYSFQVLDENDALLSEGKAFSEQGAQNMANRFIDSIVITESVDESAVLDYAKDYAKKKIVAAE